MVHCIQFCFLLHRTERGIWAGRSKKNCGPHLTAVLLTDGSQVCIVYRLSTRAVPCAALAFPSLRRFLTRRTCLLAMGKILPHPSARSARHSSPQDGGPKGKMIEGRSGGSWRGARRELWAPPDSGSAHRRIAGLYHVPTLDPSRSLRRPRISFPPPLPHRHLPAPQGKITQAHVPLGTRLRRMAGFLAESKFAGDCLCSAQ